MLELPHITPSVVIPCVVIAASLMALHAYSRVKARHYPPGPPRDPLIGNVRTMPDTHAYLYYTELKKTYGPCPFTAALAYLLTCKPPHLGDVVHIQAFGKDIIIIGSYGAADQLLSKRGNVYSERPRFPMSDKTYVVLFPHFRQLAY